MTTNEKARSTVGAAEQAMETAYNCSAAISVNENSIFDEHGQGRFFVLPLLRHGKENAIPTANLVNLTGCKTVRQLQTLIQSERKRGALILSASNNGGGYYLPADGEQGRQELVAFQRTLRARAMNTLRSLSAVKAALRIIDGQTELKEDKNRV